ncbi:MAG TPA: hypothetical protein VIQ31_30290 [Phormidium sp.]
MSEEKMSAGAEAAINEVKRRSAAYREMVAKTAVVESFSSIDPDGTRMTTQITTWQTKNGTESMCITGIVPPMTEKGRKYREALQEKFLKRKREREQNQNQ